jgi:hypothetical protein
MQQLKLYDPNRTPPNWTDVMSPTQFAVFLSDATSGGHRNPNSAVRTGESTLADSAEASCLLFDSLDEAVAYCIAQQNVPRLRLDIYDKAGKSKEPLRTFVPKEHTRRAHAGRFYLGIAFPCQRTATRRLRLDHALGMDLANRSRN